MNKNEFDAATGYMCFGFGLGSWERAIGGQASEKN